MAETFDTEKAKEAATAEVEALRGLFEEGSTEYDHLDRLWELIENDDVGKKALVINVAGQRLQLNKKDKAEAAYRKINEFVKAVRTAKGAADTEAAHAAAAPAAEVATAAEGAIEAIVPEVGKLRWRDVNAEIELLANAVKGAKDETALRDIRKLSHKRQLGKADYSVVVSGISLQLWEDDKDDEVLIKLARFVKAIKEANKTIAKPTATKAKEGIDPLYWRDVIAGIDGLIATYPDEDYSSLVKLREMLQKGEIGRDSRLLLNIGPVFLNILEKDDEETMLEKFAVFIGELKQTADIVKSGKEKPLDPELEKTYWRDILGALQELEGAYADNQQFKLLKLSIEKGILGTVKNFKATIDGRTLDIRQSDTDAEMRDKLSKFVRELSQGGVVKINEDVRKKYTKLEQAHNKLKDEKKDLQSRYEDMTSDMRQRDTNIRRLSDENARYQEEIRRLQMEVQRAKAASAPAPAPRSYRTYSG